jgi:hypothetical protein
MQLRKSQHIKHYCQTFSLHKKEIVTPVNILMAQMMNSIKDQEQ